MAKSAVSASSKLSLLTGKQWIFDSAYYDYKGPGTGRLVYARGSENNEVNLDNVRFVYWADSGNTEDLFDIIGHYAPVTWSFSNKDSTALYYPANEYLLKAVHQKILKLDATHLVEYDSTASALDICIIKP